MNDIMASTRKSVGDIVYAAIFDTCNEMIAKGFDENVALECANKVAAKYLNDDIKVRKRPTPRPEKDQ